ncbi:THUMP domain-containing class I SAM-dependent RNA methyltransferase [Chitinimonas lacunae]|uniref:Class I SAM-dependent RNA methyltransferase n=1 Tax=Chitinimonas lacunae TaxID=1963018 RepID=A0ABV8MT07_9NEIS
MKQRFHYFAPCPRGLEALLAQELNGLGAAEVKPTDGGVSFAGDWLLLMRANLHSRLASRILWRLAVKPYRNEEDLYQLARGFDWPELFDVSRTIKVVMTAQGSPLRSLDFAALKVKDAVCDRFRAKLGERPSVDTADPDLRIHVYLTEREASLYLDTSGEALFKRGYRVATGAAPLRENLAAGILQLAGWTPEQPLLDPMCGSGTFLVEAAMMALDMAPGLDRSFAFEGLRNFSADAWAKLCDEAHARCQPPRPLAIFGSDYDQAMLDATYANLDRFGLADCVTLERTDFLSRSAPAPEGVIVSNPPYGIRLDEQEQLAAFYPQLGDALKRSFKGWRAYFLTGDLRMAKLIRLSASKRTVLFNGALECRLFEFKMVEGSNRRIKPGEQAENQ